MSAANDTYTHRLTERLLRRHCRFAVTDFANDNRDWIA